MPNNYRVDRVAKEIQREIGEILLREVQDPRVKDVNITDVSLTGDLSQATVYYSLVSDLASDGQKAEAGLTAAKGLVKRSLSKKLTMYKIPDISFKRDESVAYGDKIDQMLRKLKL